MLGISQATQNGPSVLEVLQQQQQQQPTPSRRARPPNLDLSIGNENKIPLRAQTEKLHRRRSRLALSGLFGRQKPDGPTEPLETNNSTPTTAGISGGGGGIRTSLANISNWPYGLHAQRSEGTLPMPSRSPASAIDTVPTPTSAPPVNLRHKGSASAIRTHSPKKPRKPLSTWAAPPLFKAYPQAIKHTRLAASTLPVETILRAQNQKGGLTSPGGVSNQSAMNLETIEESAAEKPDSFRKRHRRNTSASSSPRIDWTTKIYVLVTAGYLLQYAGDGSFDRLPERILHLGKDSAAFASDLIPGRHWVLQVSSVAEPDGTPSLHTSFFSRFAFRGSERKSAATFLMVFESAYDMDSWIATIRREIEALGGKKNLSETGKPKTEEMDTQLEGLPSQRTLVVKDPDRFSRGSAQDMAWESAAPLASPHIHFDHPDLDANREQSFDETSTASGVSHDGHQLDSLRDSANRLSFISSGQRTVVTSAGSSPACSPTRDSFGSLPEDLPLRELPPADAAQLRVLPRPNASAILDRRQSMQTTNHILEMRAASAATRPHSIYTSSWHPENGTASNFSSNAAVIPNFSVPHSAGRRYSIIRSPQSDHGSVSPPAHQFGPSTKLYRRPPPAALSINPRPLSLVEDQPSPSPVSPRSLDPSVEYSGEVTPNTPSIFSSLEHESPGPRSPSPSESPLGRPIKPPPSQGWVQVMKAKTAPRKHASMATIRPSDREAGAAEAGSETPTFVLPNTKPISPVSSASTSRPALDIPRAGSSVDSYTRSQSPAGSHSLQRAKTEQVSTASDVIPRYPMVDSDFAVGSVSHRNLMGRSCGPAPRFCPMAPRNVVSSQHLRTDLLSQSLPNRRSMSHLVEGPPPAPPPNCALPPIPHRVS